MVRESASPFMFQSPAPLFSIGVPIYNGETFLRRALESLLAQRYANFEVIIVDDASTDASADICREHAAQDKRIHYYRNPTNIGMFRNFRRSLNLARGKYFMWAAQDDYSDPRYLAAAVEYLENNPDVVVCASDFYIVDGVGQLLRTDLLDEIYPTVPWSKARYSFFNNGQNRVYMAFYGTYRRDALLQVPLIERRYARQVILDQIEYPLLAQLATLGRIVALPEPLRTYTRHADSFSHQERARLPLATVRRLDDDMRLQLIWIALTALLPWRERIELVTHAGRYFESRTRLLQAIWGRIRIDRQRLQTVAVY